MGLVSAGQHQVGKVLGGRRTDGVWGAVSEEVHHSVETACDGHDYRSLTLSAQRHLCTHSLKSWFFFVPSSTKFVCTHVEVWFDCRQPEVQQFVDARGVILVRQWSVRASTTIHLDTATLNLLPTCFAAWCNKVLPCHTRNAVGRGRDYAREPPASPTNREVHVENARQRHSGLEHLLKPNHRLVKRARVS